MGNSLSSAIAQMVIEHAEENIIKEIKVYNLITYLLNYVLMVACTRQQNK